MCGDVCWLYIWWSHVHVAVGHLQDCRKANIPVKRLLTTTTVSMPLHYKAAAPMYCIQHYQFSLPSISLILVYALPTPVVPSTLALTVNITS